MNIEEKMEMREISLGKWLFLNHNTEKTVELFIQVIIFMLVAKPIPVWFQKLTLRE